MFDTRKVGKALSTLRKRADMTQSEFADKLNLSRQAVSKYERGESFPDISVLVMIAQLFDVTLDELIGYGDPTKGESMILKNVAVGNTDVVAENVSDVVNLAPILKPSVLEKLSSRMEKQGIDISEVVKLAEFLNDESVEKLIESATFDGMNDELLERFIPFLNVDSKETIFEKILNGELDWRLIRTLLPYAEYLETQIEAAVVAGVLPWETLDILSDHFMGGKNRRRKV